MILRFLGSVSVFLLGTALVLAQDSSDKKQSPSREEFEALRQQVKELERKNSPDGPAMPWRYGIQWRVMANAANFGWHPASIGDSEDTRSFVNQRFRAWISFSPTEKIGGYLQLEVGHIGWGEDREGTKTFDTGGDSVGIELRRGYLTYRSENSGRFQVGIQDWHDAFGESSTLGSFDAVDDYDSFGAVLANSVWDFNVGGVSWSRAFPNRKDLSLNAGVFQLWEGDSARADDAYLFGLDADLPIGEKDEGIGASLYYLKDRGGYSYPTAAPYDSSWDLWLGFRAAKKIGNIPLRGWAIINTGKRDDIEGPDFDHTGWAAKIEAFDIALGPGKLSGQMVYATGEEDPESRNSDEFRTIAQSERDNFGAQGYWSYLLLSSPHGPSDVKDLGVGLQNRGLGLFSPQVKYDYPITEKLRGTTAVGWLRSAKANPISGSRDMGAELGHTFHLDIGSGMALDFGGAYFFSGDFYQAADGPAPDDLWESFLRMQFEF